MSLLVPAVCVCKRHPLTETTPDAAIDEWQTEMQLRADRATAGNLCLIRPLLCERYNSALVESLLSIFRANEGGNLTWMSSLCRPPCLSLALSLSLSLSLFVSDSHSRLSAAPLSIQHEDGCPRERSRRAAAHHVIEPPCA